MCLLRKALSLSLLQVFVIPIMTLIHGVISMVLGYEHISAKVCQPTCTYM